MYEKQGSTVFTCIVCVIGGEPAGSREAPKVDVFAGYSYVQASPSTPTLDSFHLNGGSVSGAYHFTNWLSGVADFGAYTNGNIGRDGFGGTMSTYLFGPRISYHHFRRVTPFGQVLFGVARTNASAFFTSISQNAFAMTAGGGVDTAGRPLVVAAGTGGALADTVPGDQRGKPDAE